MSAQPEVLRLADALQQQAVWEGHYGPSYLRDLLPEAAAELRRLHAENASLAAALASSCDEQRHELWESGGVAGCERARVAERQRDALLGALRALVRNEGLDAYVYLDKGVGTETAAGQRWLNARAAIKAVEGEKA